VDAAIRFFPADWLPNLRDTRKWKAYFTRAGSSVSNPATSIVIQSKRFPLVWDQLDTRLETWRALLPETRAVADVSNSESDGWVWKPAFGRVGEDIGIAGVSEDKELSRIKRDATQSPDDWLVQRRFHAIPVERDGKAYYATIGVYTVNDRVAGAYARVCEKALINQEAQDVAVLITGKGEK
jgi:glutathionylspermidine synthase